MMCLNVVVAENVNLSDNRDQEVHFFVSSALRILLQDLNHGLDNHGLQLLSLTCKF
jgi:hypothetical protein